MASNPQQIRLYPGMMVDPAVHYEFTMSSTIATPITGVDEYGRARASYAQQDEPQATVNDAYLFYRNNPEYPQQSHEVGRMMDVYKDQNFPGYWTATKLQNTWDAIKTQWNTMAQEASLRLDTIRLKEIVRLTNTEMVFDNDSFFEERHG